MSEFRGETSEAQILDPDPGSYIVGVFSTSGYSCFREIDLVERTRLWTFDPVACRYTLDAFAHLVTGRDKRDQKTTEWYREIRRDEENLDRALEEAARAGPDHDIKTPVIRSKPSDGELTNPINKKEVGKN